MGMENKESVPIQEVQTPSVREINRTKRKFLRIVRHLPSENEEFITDMTSIFAEPDIYNKFKSDPHNIEEFHHELERMGLGEGKIKIVLNYFNLPYEKKE